MITKLLLTALLLLLPVSAWAALAVDNTTTLDQDADTDPITWTHTTNAGANMLVVACSFSDADTASTVTYNGVAMTIDYNSSHGATARLLVLAHLANPAIGAGLTVNMDLTGTADGGCYSISFSGAAGTVSGVANRAIGTATSSTLNVTCPTGSIVVDIGGHAATIETITPSQTSVLTGDDGARVYYGSREVGNEVGDGTTNMAWSWATTTTNGHHAGMCIDASGATGSIRRRTF